MRYRFATAALLTAAALACGGDDGPPTAPTPPTPACAYDISAATASFPASGGVVSVRVQTAAGCAWTASSPAAWLTLAPASGSGAADVAVTAAPNESASERSVSVTIAAKTLSARQDGRAPAPCTYAISPEADQWGGDGGPGSFQVQTQTHCSWTATTAADWVTIRTGGGTGNGTVAFTIAQYTGLDRRDANIVVADRQFAIYQYPPQRECSYTVAPTAATVHWHGPALTVRLSTGEGCTWTAASAASWLRLATPDAGSGSAEMRVDVDNHTAQTPRVAELRLRWPTPTAGQNVWVTQEGCWYALAPLEGITVAAAGGRQMLTIIASPASVDCSIGCPWQVSADVSWIRLARTSGAGDDGLFFDVDANTTGVERVGRIAMGTASVTVRQER